MFLPSPQQTVRGGHDRTGQDRTCLRLQDRIGSTEQKIQDQAEKKKEDIVDRTGKYKAGQDRTLEYMAGQERTGRSGRVEQGLCTWFSLSAALPRMLAGLLAETGLRGCQGALHPGALQYSVVHCSTL